MNSTEKPAAIAPPNISSLPALGLPRSGLAQPLPVTLLHSARVILKPRLDVITPLLKAFLFVLKSSLGSCAGFKKSSSFLFHGLCPDHHLCLVCSSLPPRLCLAQKSDPTQKSPLTSTCSPQPYSLPSQHTVVMLCNGWFAGLLLSFFPLDC
jgi:hypothetical protein